MGIIEERAYHFGKLTICHDQILELYSDKETYTFQDYKDLLNGIEEITGGKKYPYLSDERGKQRFMDNDSKKLMNDKLHKHITACALVEDSAVLRFLTHTFVAIYRPKIPIKMFKTKEDARNWLKEFME